MSLISSIRSSLLSSFYGLSLLLSFYRGTVDVDPNFRIRAVNLGGWLVTEGRAKPTLFDGIINSDLLDGSQLQFKSVKTGKYLCAEQGGGSLIVANANRTDPQLWEIFRVWRINETTFNFRVYGDQFVGLDRNGNGSGIVAVSDQTPGKSETFVILRNSDDLNRVRILAPNGYYLQVNAEDVVTADWAGSDGWEDDDDPSVFEMKNTERMEGEFQITNGYGPEEAARVMRSRGGEESDVEEHWNSFIVEEDFKFISENGLNAVRIPVGWWIASDPTPPWPFVGGSLEALDNAFLWAEKYKLNVIIDLHAAPGSQNGWEHSASRDGSQEWGITEENIQQTVDVIEFLAARYAKSPSLYAVELINEPLYPGATIEALTKYYKAGYDAVRRHSSTAFVIMPIRQRTLQPRELIPVTSGLSRSVVDIHFYNMFEDSFDTVQDNIDFIYGHRASQLKEVTMSNGPLSFVGEWVDEWDVEEASKEDYQKYFKAQLEVYGRATFGWAYWSLKHSNNHLSLQWLINNGYVNQTLWQY
ncbi:Glycoside hydrolase, family 5 [Corchorus olitorius]|uniref:Glycoside hydrolase, family 5 n=1 Tax=Corchorus olitorius TaxID=93759 RepID=A0A1R3JHI8_9ROSI|nr:Glycoside hydrolase, family 5 [Corchorus olitorius]